MNALIFDVFLDYHNMMPIEKMSPDGDTLIRLKIPTCQKVMLFANNEDFFIFDNGEVRNADGNVLSYDIYDHTIVCNTYKGKECYPYLSKSRCKHKNPFKWKLFHIEGVDLVVCDRCEYAIWYDAQLFLPSVIDQLPDVFIWIPLDQSFHLEKGDMLLVDDELRLLNGTTKYRKHDVDSIIFHISAIHIASKVAFHFAFNLDKVDN